MQRKLGFAFIAFAVLPLLVVSWLLLAYMHRNQALGLAQEASVLIKSEIESVVRERLRDMRMYTMSENLWEHNQHNLARYSNALIASHPDYKLVLMANKDGIVESVNSKDATGNPVNTSQLVGKSFVLSTWFQKALTADGPVMETPKKPEFIKAVFGDENLSVLPVAQAIKDREGTLVGVWVIFTDADFLNEIVQSVANDLGAMGRFELMNQDGKILVQYNNLNSRELGEHETATELLQLGGQSWHIKSSLEELTLLDSLKTYFWPLVVFIGLIIMYAFVVARRMVIPLHRLIDSMEQIARGKARVEIPYEKRKDEYGHLARVLKEFQPSPTNHLLESSNQIDNTMELISGLSAQANMLALNASMEAVNAHHLDPLAEKANELAQMTTYNSQELLKKLAEIKSICADIQNEKSQDKL